MGDQGVLLEILARVLAMDGYDALCVHDPRALCRVVADADIVIFEHLEPTDVYRLNPRTHGYAGPLILIGDFHSEVAQDLLRSDAFIAKPFTPDELRRCIVRLLRSGPLD